jgi:archaeosine synthase alpha-subunit
MQERILVLKSGACSWAKCCFCGYGRIPGKVPELAGMKKDFDLFYNTIQKGDTVKVFGSGSFLDVKQVPLDSRTYFIEKFKASGAQKLFIESRPEYVNEAALKEFAGIELSVAIGLEIADDALLDKINKGFHIKDYAEAADVIHRCGAKVRTYLLVNPPYAKDIKKTLDKSVEYALQHSDTIVLINLLPHGNTPVFKMWLTGTWNFLSREDFRKITDIWRNEPRVELDEETFRFLPKFPDQAKESLRGVGEEYLTHPHFEVWQDYLQRWYRPPEEKDIILFLPCSYTKPYSRSRTHQGIIETLRKTDKYIRIHQVMLSNTGVIPREFEDMYPFNTYDWDEKLETEEIKKRYIEVTKRRIKKYLSSHRNNYKTIVCFLKYSSESYQALDAACRELELVLLNLLQKETYEEIRKEGTPLQRGEALEDLLAGVNKISI